MVYCLQMYLKSGLITQNAKNIKMRKLIAETCMEFYEFVKEIENVKINERLDKQIVFDSFTSEYKDFQRFLTRKKFNIWVQKYCNFINAEYQQGNSNGFHWFEIQTEVKEELVEEELMF